jgi:cytochrome b6-f complex iron-sulfur subunit/menaquinol-cytochrome c reductase iron-sulfur subunit
LITEERVSDDKTGRRGALKALSVLGGAAACGAIALPGAAMLTAPVSKGGAGAAKWVRTVRVDALAEGVPTKVSILADARDAWMIERNKELGAVWLVRRGAAVECLSATCPHLGCSIGHDEKTGYFCPCHDSSFAPDGAQKSGPSPRGLDKLATKIEDGIVLVDYRRYRQGTPERVEIG